MGAKYMHDTRNLVQNTLRNSRTVPNRDLYQESDRATKLVLPFDSFKTSSDTVKNQSLSRFI